MILPRSLVIDCFPGLGEPSTKVKLAAVRSGIIIVFGIRQRLGEVWVSVDLLQQ